MYNLILLYRGTNLKKTDQFIKSIKLAISKLNSTQILTNSTQAVFVLFLFVCFFYCVYSQLVVSSFSAKV